MKQTKKLRKRSQIEARRDLLYMYREKYFNLWLNSRKWRGINREQREYIMRKFWDLGSVASFPIIKPSQSFNKGIAPEETENGLCGFATFAPQNFNMFNYPTAVKLINERNVPYIPSKLMISGKDVVLGFAQHSRQPLKVIVENYINRLVNIEMTIRTNLFAHKLPFAVEVGPKSLDNAQRLMDSILDDEVSFFVNEKELDSLRSVSTGTPYIIDKLYNYKMAIENELLTFLGINNLGNIEKKERLLNDEINSNNDLVEDYADSIDANLKEFCELTNEIFGFNISVEHNIKEEKEETEEGEENNE